MPTTVRVLGNQQLARALLAAGPALVEDFARGIYEEGQLAFRQSQKEVPVRDGFLKNSGRLHLPVISGTRVDVDITYGSSAVDYAAPVHELQKNYREGRKRYYLKDPVEARVPNMEARLARRIQRIVKQRMG